MSQIVIGAIIENSPAERDGRLRPGDELVSVDRMPVGGRPHSYVIDLMHAAARNGQVTLTVRRRVMPLPGEFQTESQDFIDQVIIAFLHFTTCYKAI